MAQRDILVIGASAGGVDALRTLVAGLPQSLAAAVFVVLHIPPHDRSQLAQILGNATRLPVHAAINGMPVTPGQIYVAVPDHHLLLEKSRLRVTRGPRENRARPAIDVLFRSAAYHFGPRVIGIVLSGNLDDGTAGLWAIKDRGGVVMVQSPEEAPFPSMPLSALQHVAVDQVLPVAAMPAAIAGLIQEAVSPDVDESANEGMKVETSVALDEQAKEGESLRLGALAPLSCPECHGTLVQIQEGSLLRYRCHVGHAFSSQTLLAQMGRDIEASVTSMLRAGEERTFLLRILAQQSGIDETKALQYARLIAESEKWTQRVRAMRAEQDVFDIDLWHLHRP